MKHAGFIVLSGFIFFGQYFNSTSFTDVEGRDIKYRAGIHLDLPTIKKGPVLFVEDETLIKDEKDMGFHPVQTNYKIGLSQKIGAMEAIFLNECRHPVDGKSGSRQVQDFMLIEFRYHFK